MKSSCVITFEGLNINRLLNSLCKQGITLLSVERQGKRCKIEVLATVSRKVVAQLEEKCYNIQNIRYKGAANVARFIKMRFIMPIAVILCAFLLSVSSQFCWKIEVQGDYDKESVCNALATAGVRIGGSMRSIDVDAVENSVANSMNAMYAVVSRKGSVVYVNVVAKKTVEPPIDMNVRHDIVATCSGVVTNVLCEQGTSLVKVGDNVNVGDVLIEGRRIFNDGESRDVYALGRVTVELTAVGFAEYTGVRTVENPTGNTFKSVGVVLFGNEYGRKCPFERYTVDTSSTYLYPLNLELRTNVYTETESVTVSATLDECVEDLKQSAYRLAEEKCDFEIKDVKYVVTESGVEVRLIGSAELH